MPDLDVSLLGPPKILINGVEFDTDRRKAIALLAYLVLSGTPQPREHLAATFWPDYNRDSAFAYLRRTLFELNKGLGKGRLETDRFSAGFVPSGDTRIDIALFQSELAASRLDKDPVPHLEAAVKEYRGEFMQGFFLKDTEPFEDWLRVQRERFRQEYALSLEQLAANYEQRGAWEQAINYARAWLELDEFDEAAHRAIMRIYAGMGDRSRAFRQYEMCAQVLKDGLGIEPQQETTVLLERIRAGSFEEAVRAAEATRPDTGPASNIRLPVLTTPFIGRRPEIEQIKEFILNRKTRLLTLFGPGGSGKTRLSIQAASEIGDHFQDGVWFVPLATVQSAEGIIPALAKSLSFSFYQEEDTRNQQIIDYLREKHLLLILDNVDQLVGPEAAGIFNEILTGAEGVKIMVTSRIRLNLQAEQIFTVQGMRMPTSQEVESWSDPETQALSFSAVQLFLDRARRLQPGFLLNREHAAAVGHICQLVHGMPLGLELAASWLELLPPDEIAREIRRSLDFLETDRLDVPERQRSIRAVYDYSWKLLNEIEREAFLSLSVFLGSFSREAAQQVSGATLRTLLSLANKSWLLQAEDGRFQLHPLLQHYGYDQLRRRQDLWQSARERHADYYAGFVARQFSRMQSAEQMAAAQDLTDEFNTNVKAAWDWLVENARWALIREKMLPGLFQFGLMRWRSDELITWMQNARSRIQPGVDPEEKLTFAILGTIEVNFEEIWGFKENRPEDRMESLWSLAVTEGLADEMGIWFILLGKLYTYRKVAPEADALLDNAIDRLRTVGDPWQLGSALLLRSSLWGQFPTEAADRNLSEALKIFKNLGTIHEQAIILENMAANASVRKLPLEEVIDLYQQAQGYYLKLNDPFGVGETYKNLGDLYFSQGQREKGFEAYHEMRRAFERLGDLRLVSESLSWESLWATRYSTFQHALETRQRSLGLFRKYGSQTFYFWNVFELGEVYRIFGDCQKAREFFNEAGEYFEGIHFTLGMGYTQRALGDIAMGERRYADACRHYQAFLDLVEQDNHMWSMAQAGVKMAWVEAHLGNVPSSRSRIHRGLKSLLDTNELNLILEALLCEARCLAEEGKTGPSADLAAIVRDHPVTWNETRSLARSLVEALSENRTLEFIQGPGSIPQANDVRGLASNWIANYEAGLFSS